jgi:proprotein convertase subtilisin/kexin type 5
VTKAHLESLQLVLHGTQSVPQSVSAIPKQCHSQCLRGCARKGAEYCDSCKRYRLAETFECVENCPIGTYLNENTCRYCPTSCAECSNPHSCSRCLKNAFHLDDGSCSDSCREGTFPASNQSCILCHQSCMSCDGPLDTNCTGCYPQLTLHDHTCMIHESTSCPERQYFDHRAHECRRCHKSCSSCDGKESTRCTSCFGGAVLNEEGRCADTRHLRQSCYPGEYFDGHSFECAACPPSCGNCSDNLTCNSCLAGVYLTEHGTCVESCSNLSACAGKHCHPSCLTCSGLESFHCNSCPEGLLFLNNSCVQSCPAQYIQSNLTCMKCHGDCETCDGPTEKNCTTCPQEKLLSGHSCVVDCPTGSYNQENTCLKCTAGCANCTTRDSCNQCTSRYYLLDTPPDPRCVSHCPDGYIAHPASSSCEPCPDNCAICSTISTCQTCQSGYAYYAPSGSCRESCPPGYYKTPTGECTACQLPCSTCVGSALNCSSCSGKKALDTASSLCRDCCNADRTMAQCCDCDQDSVFCHLTNLTSLLDPIATPTPSTADRMELATLLIVGIGTAVALFLVLCVVSLCLLFRYCRSRSNPSYMKVPNQDTLNITAGDMYNTSDSDADLFTNNSVAVS